MLHLLYFAAAFATGGEPEWTWNTFPTLGFKVLSPCELTDQVAEVPTEFEVVQYHQMTCGNLEDKKLPMSFVIDHYKLPGEIGTMTAVELDAFFDNTIDPIMEAIDGTVVYADVHSQGDQDICSWKATYQNGACLIRGESMIIDGHYYGLQVFGLTSKKPEDMMNKFFESFRRLDSTTINPAK
jgi:hypothetical protein